MCYFCELLGICFRRQSSPHNRRHHNNYRQSTNVVSSTNQTYLQDNDPLFYITPADPRPMSQLTEAELVQVALRMDIIANLPCAKYDESKREKHVECIVCMCEYEIGEDLRYLPCLHAFHRACIDNWLMRSLSCPSCLEQIKPQTIYGSSASSFRKNHSHDATEFIYPTVPAPQTVQSCNLMIHERHTSPSQTNDSLINRRFPKQSNRFNSPDLYSQDNGSRSVMRSNTSAESRPPTRQQRRRPTQRSPEFVPHSNNNSSNRFPAVTPPIYLDNSSATPLAYENVSSSFEHIRSNCASLSYGPPTNHFLPATDCNSSHYELNPTQNGVSDEASRHSDSKKDRRRPVISEDSRQRTSGVGPATKTTRNSSTRGSHNPSSCQRNSSTILNNSSRSNKRLVSNSSSNKSCESYQSQRITTSNSQSKPSLQQNRSSRYNQAYQQNRRTVSNTSRNHKNGRVNGKNEMIPEGVALCSQCSVDTTSSSTTTSVDSIEKIGQPKLDKKHQVSETNKKLEISCRIPESGDSIAPGPVSNNSDITIKEEPLTTKYPK